MKPIDPGERHEEQADPEGNRSGSDECAQRRFAPATESEPQSEADHRKARSSEATFPSRTTTSRSAYAATRGSWVTKTTVVPC